MKRSTIDRQLAYCQAIIDRPTTSNAERMAAESAKERLAKLKAKAEPEWTWTPRFEGGKYQATKHLYGADLTALIRREIALRRKLGKIGAEPGALAVPDPIGDAPEQIKITVSYPRGSAIRITVRNIPEDWGYCPRPKGINHEMSPGPSDDLLRLGIALRELADDYNMDDSDAMTDHYHNRFYLNVYDTSHQSIDRDYWRTLREAEYAA